MSIFPQAWIQDPGPRPKVWHPVSGRCFPARTGDPESPAATPGRNQRWIDFLRSTGGKEAIREAQNRGRGYRGVAGLARSGPGGPGPPCVLTYLRFGLNQGPAMLERVLAPSLVSQFGSSSPLRGLVGDREDRVRQPPPERLVVAELLEQLRVVL